MFYSLISMATIHISKIYRDIRILLKEGVNRPLNLHYPIIRSNTLVEITLYFSHISKSGAVISIIIHLPRINTIDS